MYSSQLRLYICEDLKNVNIYLWTVIYLKRNLSRIIEASNLFQISKMQKIKKLAVII